MRMVEGNWGYKKDKKEGRVWSVERGAGANAQRQAKLVPGAKKTNWVWRWMGRPLQGHREQFFLRALEATGRLSRGGTN